MSAIEATLEIITEAVAAGHREMLDLLRTTKGLVRISGLDASPKRPVVSALDWIITSRDAHLLPLELISDLDCLTFEHVYGERISDRSKNSETMFIQCGGQWVRGGSGDSMRGPEGFHFYERRTDA